MQVKKAIIAAAGQGTRMKYITSIIPKILLPLYASENGTKVMVPVVDVIRSSLKGAGITDICFIVGKNKRIIEKYVGKDTTTYFKQKGKGFGAAILSGEEFSNGDPVLVHTDDILLTAGYDVIIKLFEGRGADAVFFARKVENPTKYGVVTVSDKEEFMQHDVYKVTGAEEKPEKPKNDIAIVGVYIFSSKIFEGLKKTHKKNHELTYGIQSIIESGGKVYAIMMKDEKRLNVGDPDSYFGASRYTYEAASSG